MKAEFDKVCRKARFRAQHAEIRHQCEAKATPNSRSLDRADNRLFAGEQPHGLGVEWIAGFNIAQITLRLATMKICPGTKMFTVCGEDDSPTIHFFIQSFKRIGQGLNEGRIKEIVWRSLNLGGCHMIGQGYFNISIACLHRYAPFILSALLSQQGCRCPSDIALSGRSR